MTKLELHLAVLAATSTGGFVTHAADAAIAYSGIVNINIPSTADGVYLNVVTGMTGSTGATTPGWDINPWSSTGLGWFSPTSPAGGAYTVTSPGVLANLFIGSVVGASNTFGSGISSNVGMWNLNSDLNFVGFRFLNEATAQVHYGWLRLGLGSSASGQPRRIVEYFYETTPGVATIVWFPTPGVTTLAMIAGAGLMGRRRRLQR